MCKTGRFIYLFINKVKMKKSSDNFEMKKREPYDILFKVILLGNSGVGKTSLIRQFLGEKVCYEHLQTIGN